MSSGTASKKAERLEKKLQSQLRACQKEPGNKRCADCTERVSGPQAVLCATELFLYMYIGENVSSSTLLLAAVSRRCGVCVRSVCV